MPKIHDCFTFFNELDLLDIRLNELDPVVDRFVLVEAAVTQRGQPKPLFFRDNRERFAKFLPKIEHVVVEDMPAGPQTTGNNWKRENFQRRAIMRGLAAAQEDDFVLISDLDEIPRAEAIAATAARSGRSVYALEMENFRFFMNLRIEDDGARWNKSRMARFGDVRDPQRLRSAGPQWRPAMNQHSLLRRLRHYRRMMTSTKRPMWWKAIPSAGWHFSAMNGVAAVRQKLNSIVENIDQLTDRSSERAIAAEILGHVEDGGKYKTRLLPVDGRFPGYLAAHRDRFRHLIADAESIAELRRMAGKLETAA